MTGITPSSSLAANVLAMRNAVLQQNEALRIATQPTVATPATPVAPQGPAAFGDALRSAVASVNDLQAQSSSMSEAFERGQVTDIAEVMLARQKASVGFEATLQVRNKLLSAYSDIMNMPL